MAPNHNVVETSVIHRSTSTDDRNDAHAMINQYAVLGLLGEGMHGKVMLASNTENGESVAIKSMRRVDPRDRRLPKSNRPGTAVSAQQETESKIRREIAVMKKCTHQNLVRLLEVINDPRSQKIYLVMEHLAGGEVLWRTKDGEARPVLALDQVQRIMRDVTLGLEYLHHQGIVHRDIKPANLLWTADRQSVKICDFGVSHFSLASAQDDAYDEVGLSKTLGSPAFFAPEVCHFVDEDPLLPSSAPPQEQPPITEQLDIWALGVTFYCLLFGTPPWQGHNEYDMFRSICKDDFVVPTTMASEGIPTGGRNHLPEGEGLGWCVVDLLTGLLQKDQTKRMTLAAIKRILWIQTGVRDPARWLLETAPESQTRVTITVQDTEEALKPAWRNNTHFKLIKDKIRNSFLNPARPRPPSRRENATAGPSTNGASTERNRSTVDRNLKRFKIGSASPSRANTMPKEHRRGAGSHAQVRSDPQPRSATYTPPSPACASPCNSLRPPTASSSTRNFFGASTSSTSPATSPTTPSEESQGGVGFRSRRVWEGLRQKSAKVVGKAKGAVHPGRSRDEPRGRASAEVLEMRSSTESSGLSSGQRSASWGGGVGSPDEEDLSSETDPTRSVTLFGAGGYVDRPAQYQAAGMTHSDSSSNSTATNATPQAHDPSVRVQRVTSPLARGRASYGRNDAEDDDSGEEGLSSDAFDADPDSSDDDDDALELRTRRPSVVLSRSANTSPLR